ncbi:unnamed protein product [Adineta steineri]|uniref:Ubiquitin carboxyl-terminal hydrolase 36 n=3 Tax=Adineta steineri TaxID=433720 RepID=A0A818UP04_9BILA|nr:unnamed protein product [Adineta steineri]
MLKSSNDGTQVDMITNDVPCNTLKGAVIPMKRQRSHSSTSLSTDTALESTDNQIILPASNIQKHIRKKLATLNNNDPYDFNKSLSNDTPSLSITPLKNSPDNIITTSSLSKGGASTLQTDIDDFSPILIDIYSPPQNRKRACSIDSDFEIISPPKRSRELLASSMTPTVNISVPHHVASLLSTKNDMALTWSLIKSRGVGLMNNGTRDKNLCFINAVVQGLAHTPALAQWLINQQHKWKKCQITSDDRFCSVCHLTRIVVSIHETSQNVSSAFRELSVASAHPLSRNITDLSDTFMSGRQEDSEEFLNCLLNHLVKCLIMTNVPSTSSRPYTTIDNLFQFELKSSIKCSECKQTTNKMEPYFVWNVPIDGHKTLPSALNKFCLPELLSDDNAYSCGYCCKYVQASKRLSIVRTSPYLIFSLKRFRSGLQNTQKLTHFVAYPEILDITSYFSDDYPKIPNDNSNKENFHLLFRLYCVIVHLGHEVDKGHLFAYIRGPDDMWYKANDSTITPVKVDQVLSTNDAYLLFYGETPSISFPMESSPKTNTLSSSLNSVQQIDDSTDALCPSTSRPVHESVQTFSYENDELDRTLSCVTNIPKHHARSEASESNEELFPESINGSSESTITIGKNTYTFDSVHSKTNVMNNYKIRSAAATNTTVVLDANNNNNDDDDASNLTSNLLLHNTTDDSISDQSTMLEPSEDDFHATLPTSHHFRLQSIHLLELQELRSDDNKKKRDRILAKMGLDVEETTIPSNKNTFSQKTQIYSTTVTNVKSKTSPLRWLYIILPYTKHYNSFCGLCVKKKNFGRQMGLNALLLRVNFRCSGRPTCPFSCSVFIYNNGRCEITASDSNIHHRAGDKICRPMREPLRAILKEKLMNGASVFRVRREQDEKRSKLERLGGNYDLTGTSIVTIKTIKQEALSESLLSKDVEESLSSLFDYFCKKINKGGAVSGAIQLVSRHPRKIIVYTEESIRLYDKLLNYPDAIISWDATGGILKQYGGQRVLYYELTMTLPNVTKEHSLVPISFMISDSHSEIDVKHWLDQIKDAHKKDARKKVNKYLERKLHEIGMWCIALLVNTNEWEEFQTNWLLICQTFCCWHTDTSAHSNSPYDVLLNRISKIKGDPNIRSSIGTTRDNASMENDVFTFDEDQDESFDTISQLPNLHNSKRVQSSIPRVIDEETLLNTANSPFKDVLTTIYHQSLEQFNIARSTSIKDHRSGILGWLNYLIKYFLPTSPIWSNLLLGDLKRHTNTIQHIEAWPFDEQRSTANSERRMCILKRTQLGGKIHARIDVVLSLLVKDMCFIVNEFYTSLVSQTVKNTSASQQTLKLIKEQWQQKNKRGQGHYTKTPDDNVMLALKSKLLAPSTEQINNGLTLPSLKPEWLDVAIGILISIESVRDSIVSSTYSRTRAIEDKVVAFIRQYTMQMNADIIANRKTQRKTIDKFNTDSLLSIDVPSDSKRQLSFILDTIILPIANNRLEAIKTFTCMNCKKVIRTYFSSISPITLNISQSNFCLEIEIVRFFSDTTSDQICTSCSVPLIRRISVIHWPDTLFFTINASRILSSRSQKAPQVMNLEQFNEPINIGSPATSIFDLTCFIAMHKFSTHEELVRVTKIKTKWLSSIHQKIIGEGEQFRSLYANSRKFSPFRGSVFLVSSITVRPEFKIN